LQLRLPRISRITSFARRHKFLYLSILTPQTRRTLKDSFQTFAIAFVLLIFDFGLTFVQDLAVITKRPNWLIKGIEIVEVVLFICDILVLFAVTGRIVLKAVKELIDNA